MRTEGIGIGGLSVRTTNFTIFELHGQGQKRWEAFAVVYVGSFDGLSVHQLSTNGHRARLRVFKQINLIEDALDLNFSPW